MTIYWLKNAVSICLEVFFVQFAIISGVDMLLISSLSISIYMFPELIFKKFIDNQIIIEMPIQ